MKLTKEQKESIVKFNISQAKAIIQKASGANKGRYCHSINSNIGALEARLKNTKDIKYGSKEFLEICVLKQELAGDLYLALNNL